MNLKKRYNTSSTLSQKIRRSSFVMAIANQNTAMTKSQFIAAIYLQRIKDRIQNHQVVDDDHMQLVANYARDIANESEKYITFDPE